jgi:hypothetical protein
VKKSNDKVSQNKIKRANKNKKRMQDKPHLSRFERRQKRIREELLLKAVQTINNI